MSAVPATSQLSAVWRPPAAGTTRARCAPASSTFFADQENGMGGIFVRTIVTTARLRRSAWWTWSIICAVWFGWSGRRRPGDVSSRVESVWSCVKCPQRCGERRMGQKTGPTSHHQNASPLRRAPNAQIEVFLGRMLRDSGRTLPNRWANNYGQFLRLLRQSWRRSVVRLFAGTSSA